MMDIKVWRLTSLAVFLHLVSSLSSVTNTASSLFCLSYLCHQQLFTGQMIDQIVKLVFSDDLCWQCGPGESVTDVHLFARLMV